MPEDSYRLAHAVCPGGETGNCRSGSAGSFAISDSANAILFSSTVALVLALTGSFVKAGRRKCVARLVTYTGASASTLILRNPRFETR